MKEETIKLYDENNNEMEFYIQGKFDLDDDEYVALYPIEGENKQMYILKILKDEDGNCYFSGIEDDELEEAKKAYEELLEEL